MDVAALLERYRRQGLKIATAESCTGGLVAASLTAIAGSSDVFERGWVTYSNEAKHETLGVPVELISAKGSVSAEVAEAMAKGALAKSHADIAVSITGVAGPGGGSAEKPVGLVFVGVAGTNGLFRVERCLFDGDRNNVRRQSVEKALALLSSALSPH